LRGIDETVKIKTAVGEVTMNTKGWNAVIWGVYTQRLEYLKILFEQLSPNLNLALNVNPEKPMFPEGK
jgi:hypothetical protein